MSEPKHSCGLSLYIMLCYTAIDCVFIVISSLHWQGHCRLQKKRGVIFIEKNCKFVFMMRMMIFFLISGPNTLLYPFNLIIG